jgi:hypothetical protein
MPYTVLSNRKSQHNDENDFIVYPSITNGFITIEIINERYLDGELFIHDILGRKLSQQAIPNGKKIISVDIEDKISGVYLIQLSSEDGSSITRKIIKID